MKNILMMLALCSFLATPVLAKGGFGGGHSFGGFHGSFHEGHVSTPHLSERSGGGHVSEGIENHTSLGDRPSESHSPFRLEEYRQVRSYYFPNTWRWWMFHGHSNQCYPNQHWDISNDQCIVDY